MNVSKRNQTALPAAVMACLIGLSTTNAAMAGAKKKEKHFDVWIQLFDGQITTGAVSEGDPFGVPIAENHRVFGAEFGEDKLFPFAATEPGLQAFDGTFDPLTSLTFDILAPLGEWNGGGFDVAGDTMTIGFGPDSVTQAPALFPALTSARTMKAGFTVTGTCS